MKLKVTVNGTAYEIDVEVAEETRPSLGSIVIGGAGAGVPSAPVAPTTSAGGNAVTAPLAGSVFKILVEEGQEVKAGEVVLILEAMKMETEITAPHDGTVSGILVGIGDPVQGGQPLIELG